MQNDGALIRQILSGDQTAFAELVKKYQKQVHVLAWRKIGDFHIAEDITQDTFLKVYQKLHTLKDPNQFSGWLYVITTNLCNTWLSKNRIHYQASEDIETTMIERDVYSRHITEERVKTSVEAQREVVKRLLAKLKESERTVMTLHYLAEMTIEEISKFLGVSAGTIKSRLQRARNRLQKEETMIREALEHFQISPNLTENIMQEISRIKPTPSTSKPLVPWVIAAASAVMLVLLLGIGSQHLLRFQQPYNLDAQAETTVELVDAPIVLNIDTNPDIRNQSGNSNPLGISENDGQKPDEVLLAAAETEEEDKVSTPKQQWIQSGAVIGSSVEHLFATDEGELYTVLDAYVYKWQNDRTGWQQLSGNIGDYHDRLSKNSLVTDVPIAKWDNTLYIVLENLLLASKDDGKTWNIIHTWPYDPLDLINAPRELVFTEQAIWVIFSKGAFRSEDKGKTWQDVDDDELFQGNFFFKAIQNTVFVGTNTGLYRWKTDCWERIELPVPKALRVLEAAVTKDRLYVKASLGSKFYDYIAIGEGRQQPWWIFRSDDLGNSWKDITPTNAWPLKGQSPDIQLIAAGETIMLVGEGVVRSTDAGDTWLPPQAPPHTVPTGVESHWPSVASVALNERVFYTVGRGLHRSTDGGKSWSKVNITPNRRWFGIQNLISYQRNNRKQGIMPILYGRAGSGIVKTTDNGKSWKTVQVDIPMTAPVREYQPFIIQISSSDSVIYAKGSSHYRRSIYPIGELRFYRVSENDNKLVPIQGIPTFDSIKLKDYLRKTQNLSIEALQKDFSGATQFFQRLLTPGEQETIINQGLVGGQFAVSDNTFYLEYNYKLFRWEAGDREWQDTGQEETVELTWDIARIPLKLAVSEDTIYVGKRDGHLVVSFDRGNNWIDLTPALPFPVKTFKDIVVTETTVYVATDAGIITSDDGRNWQVVTDSEGTSLIMEHLAVDGTTLYGINKNTGIYRLGNGTWKQIVSEIPDNITSLAVDRNTLYVGTQNNGMLHFNLEE